MYSSKFLEQLIEELTKLPSVGQKSAQRLALYLVRVSREEALRLADAIRAVKEHVGFCSVCGNFSEEDPCLICRDSQRDASLVCVVEQPVDVLAFEDLRIRPLLDRLRTEPIKEIILATNPNVAGEATALYLSRLLTPLGLKVTRIARGVPMGSDLEYSDLVTLTRALEGRREVD